jgi:hypothetical protein
MKARSPYLYPPRTGWPSYSRRHWVPFSSRVTMELFDPSPSKSKSKPRYYRRPVGQSVLVSGQILFAWQLWVSWCGAPSLTRGWVCDLLVQLLPGLARAVTLGSESRRTHDHILLSHLRLQVPLFKPPRNRVDQLYPRAMGSSFVAFYDSHDYGGSILTRIHTGKVTLSKSKSCYDWRSVGQSVCLGAESTLELVTRYYFLSESCCVDSVGRPL